MMKIPSWKTSLRFVFTWLGDLIIIGSIIALIILAMES